MAVALNLKNIAEAALERAGLGTKRICPSCGARFYDLSKRPIECPKCRFAFEPEALLRARRPRPDLREIAVPISPVMPEVAEEELVEEEAALGEPLEEEEEVVVEAGEEVLADELVEAEEEGVIAPAETRRRKRKPAVPVEDEVLPEEEAEPLEGEDEEEIVEGALEEDEDVSDILEDDLNEDVGR